MAKRRRSAAQKAAFKKMIAGLHRSQGRRAPGGGTTVVLANPRRRSRKRRRSRSVVVMANPRRRRHRRAHMRHNPRFRRRRRNPGMGEMLKTTAKVALPAVLGGASFGLVDSKFLTPMNLSAPVHYGIKAAYGLALGLLFRKSPLLSASAMGGVFGSLGSDIAASLGGGTPAATTPAAAVKGIGALLREDPAAMGLLIQQMRGMGYVLDTQARLNGMGSIGVGDSGGDNYTDVNLG